MCCEPRRRWNWVVKNITWRRKKERKRKNSSCSARGFLQNDIFILKNWGVMVAGAFPSYFRVKADLHPRQVIHTHTVHTLRNPKYIQQFHSISVFFVKKQFGLVFVFLSPSVLVSIALCPGFEQVQTQTWQHMLHRSKEVRGSIPIGRTSLFPPAGASSHRPMPFCRHCSRRTSPSVLTSRG